MCAKISIFKGGTPIISRYVEAGTQGHAMRKKKKARASFLSCYEKSLYAMDIQDLEKVLNWFYKNRCGYIYYPQIHEYAKVNCGTTYIETQIIIQKLVKDGFIIEEAQLKKVTDGKTGAIKEESTEYGYFITFDGIFFKESGGYHQQLLDIASERESIATSTRQNKLINILLVVGSISAGVGAIALLIWDYYKYSQSLN